MDPGRRRRHDGGVGPFLQAEGDLDPIPLQNPGGDVEQVEMGRPFSFRIKRPDNPKRRLLANFPRHGPLPALFKDNI